MIENGEYNLDKYERIRPCEVANLVPHPTVPDLLENPRYSDCKAHQLER